MFYQDEENIRESREKYPPAWADYEYDPDDDDDKEYSFLP